MRGLLIAVLVAISFAAFAGERFLLRSSPQDARTFSSTAGAAQSGSTSTQVGSTGSQTSSTGSQTTTGSTSQSSAATGLIARDEGNGEILLEWPVQPNAVGYRVTRAASGIPTVSIAAGNHTNAMDFAGLAANYSYALLAKFADGSERQVSSYNYTLAAALNTRTAQSAGRVPQLRSAVGTNLAPVVSFSTELPFVDAMKSADAWISGDSSHWNNGLALDLDANGWVRSLAPGQIAQTLMLRSIGTNFPAGAYLVRYQGEGTLTFEFSANATVVSQSSGQTVIQVTPSNDGLYMGITATNPANYIRNIEVIMPGGICEGDPFTLAASAASCGSARFLPFADYSGSIIFNPSFVNRLRTYSALRFMEWLNVNNSPVTSWSQATPVSNYTWAAGNGVPPEIVVALANRVGAHPWVNLPHQSDDVYAQNFAQLMQGRLDPTLGVYVEYSNEVWNGQFAQHNYSVTQAAAQSPAIDNTQYYALRSHNVGSIFKSTLGAQRTVAVLGAQSVNPWTATWGMDYLKARFGATTTGIDAIAIAPYLAVSPDPSAAAQYHAMTVDQLYTQLQSQIVPANTSAAAAYRAAASSYGVHLIAYEGGQSFLGILGAENDDILNTLFDAMNRDPRMKSVYLNYFTGWKQAGGELFMHFNDAGTYSKWGRWGSLEYIDQPRTAAPKFDGVQTFMEQNPVWWGQ